MQKGWHIKCLLLMLLVCSGDLSLWGMMPGVHLLYSRTDGNRAFLVNTPDGVRIFTKKYKKNYNSNDQNDTNRALLLDMAGVNYKQIWQGNSYPIIAAISDNDIAYLLCVGENENQKVVSVFHSDGRLVTRHTFEHKICSATPIKVGNEIGFIVMTHAQYAKAFVWFLHDNDGPLACLQQNDIILSCAGVDSTFGYQILTGSESITYDGFMKVWDYASLSHGRFGSPTHRLQINSLSWWNTMCSNVCQALPKGIVNLLPAAIVNTHDDQDRFVDIAAIQAQDGDVFFIAGSENGAKIGKLKEGGVEFQPDIALLRGELVSCVAAMKVCEDDLFLAPLGEKLYIYTVYGGYVQELNFNKKKDSHVDGLSALYLKDKIYIVLKNEEKFFTWALDSQTYDVIEFHQFSLKNIM